MPTIVKLSRDREPPDDLPRVDLEAVRDYVNRLPRYRLDRAAMAAWQSAKGGKGDRTRDLYIVAFIASRIADERIWDALPAAL